MSERVELFLQRLERLSVDDLEVLAIEPRPIDARDALLDAADDAARGAGRLDELDEAADAASAAILRALSFRGLEPTWLGLNWGRTPGRAEDRAALIAAVEDAAVAAVVADLVPETAQALAAPYELLASMRAATTPANPTSSTQRNAVRLVWAFAVIAAVVVGYVTLSELAAEVAREIDPCGGLLCLLGSG